MNVKRPITPLITIGDQPTEDDLKSLKDEGYVGLVNLRNDGEPEQPLGTAAEGERARALGLDYLHYGVGADSPKRYLFPPVQKLFQMHVEGRELKFDSGPPKPPKLAMIPLPVAPARRLSFSQWSRVASSIGPNS